MKMLLFSAVVLVVVVLALGVLSTDTLTGWGAKSADFALKGARGGQVFVESFKQRLQDKGTEAPK